MIFVDFNKNSLDDNRSLINQNTTFFKTNIEIKNKMKKIILNYMQNFSESNKFIDTDSVNSVHDFLENLKKSINLCNENISNLEILVKHIDNIINSTNENLTNLINTYNSDYCKLNDIICKNTMKIHDCLGSISEKSEFLFSVSSNEDNFFLVEPLHPHQIEDNIETAKTPEASITSYETISQNETKDTTPQKIEEDKKKILAEPSESALDVNDNTQKNYIENTLIVSEKNNEVILPFDLTEVKEVCKSKNNKFSSIDEVIEKKYTLPLSIYKNTFVARFKEAFKLMRHKEKASIVEAFDLGFEVMFNYNLHPAIISACKSLDELDIYLDYLEIGETQKFNCFKIIFDLPPAIIKSKKQYE